MSEQPHVHPESPSVVFTRHARSYLAQLDKHLATGGLGAAQWGRCEGQAAALRWVQRLLARFGETRTVKAVRARLVALGTLTPDPGLDGERRGRCEGWAAALRWVQRLLRVRQESPRAVAVQHVL